MKDIAHYYKNTEIVSETAKQIIKDFQLFDMEISFSGNIETAYEELHSKITPFIKNLADKNYNAFLNFLYRIDISEQKIRKINIRESSFEAEIAHLIIRREMEKVVLRKFYPNPGSKTP